MARETLIDFFEDFAGLDEPFIVHDDGYRVRQVTYRVLADAARAFARRLSDDGVLADEKVVIWSENRAEWVAALWGCLIARVVLVPVDFRASIDLVHRISDIVDARAILIGAEVQVSRDLPAAVWPLADVIAFEAPGASPPEARPSTSSGGPEPVEGRPPGPPEPLSGSSLAEIIFTSGATADPKGVTLTHRNVLANIIPIEREIRKYRRYERPFHPVRFLNLLPLSHMFGQSMATFVPPMLAGTVVFSHGYSPTEILHQITSRRVSVLVCVPKVLDVLRAHVERLAPTTADPDPLEGRHWAWRWWHYRAVHRMFGWKFWCIVCGAAPLDPALEAFWRKLGFLVVQGYGLTETAPVVTLNHPFHPARGTVGKPIAGVELKLAPDGEILVRGDNVTSGYYRGGATETDTVASEDGWFHTGDIGEVDGEGRLMIKGRKKELIVTPQGLNVYPEDVERALLAQGGLRDAGVIGLPVEGEERVHAVLVVEPEADPAAIVRGANATLDDHQRVWSHSIWPGEALPRTEGTQKLKRRELQRWAAGAADAAPPDVPGGATVASVVRRFSAGSEVTSGTTIDEIGLSSLDRVEMMMALEEAFQVTLEESQVAACSTIADLESLVALGGLPGVERGTPERVPAERRPATGPEPAPPGRRPDAIRFPSWNRSRLSWFIRRISLPTWILPLARPFLQLRVEGLEHVAGDTPVIFAANHQSHMDAPTILLALPAHRRYRVAPAMSKEFFQAHFSPERFSRAATLKNRLYYYLSCQFFNAFPLPQREAGTRQTLRYIGDVLSGGYSVLLFPEGRREGDGIAKFQPGVGMMAARLNVPVVPVRIQGLDSVLGRGMRWPKRGPVRISFGAPMTLIGQDYPALADRVERIVRALGS